MKKPILLIMISAILWGTISWFVKHLYHYGFTPMEVVTLRVWSTALLLVVYFGWTSRDSFRLKSAKDLSYFIGTGIFSIIFFNYCMFTAINVSTIPIATTLLYTAPAFVTILSFFLFKEPITRSIVVALIGTFIGVCLVAGLFPFHANQWNMKAVLFGLGSGLGYGLYSIFGKFALRKYTNITVTLYTFMTASIAMVPFFPYHEKFVYVTDPYVLFLIIGLGLFPTAIAFILYTYGLQYVKASTAAIISTIEPIVATCIGIFIFNELFTFPQLIGMLCILGAVVYTQWQQSHPTTMKRNSYRAL